MIIFSKLFIRCSQIILLILLAETGVSADAPQGQRGHAAGAAAMPHSSPSSHGQPVAHGAGSFMQHQQSTSHAAPVMHNNQSNWNRQSYFSNSGQGRHEEHHEHHEHHEHNVQFVPFIYYLNTYPAYDDDSYVYPDTEDSNNTYTASGSTETWVSAQGGEVPSNAVVNNNDNSGTTYYCRAAFDNNTYYGILVANEGCYAKTNSATILFNDYEVMVQP